MRLPLLLLVFLVTAQRLPAQSDTVIKKPDAKLVSNQQIFPFRFNEVESKFDLLINLTDSAVIHVYRPLFRKYGLPFESEVWEEVMTQILDKVDPHIADKVEYMDGDYGLYISTRGNRLLRETYLKDMLMVFLNRVILDSYLRTMDATRIEDIRETKKDDDD